MIAEVQVDKLPEVHVLHGVHFVLKKNKKAKSKSFVIISSSPPSEKV